MPWTTPVRGKRAGTQPSGKAGELRAGQWRDLLSYGRLRDDPAPAI